MHTIAKLRHATDGWYLDYTDEHGHRQSRGPYETWYTAYQDAGQVLPKGSIVSVPQECIG